MKKLVALVLTIILLGFQFLSAQDQDYSPKLKVSYVGVKPFLKDNDGISFTSSVHFVNFFFKFNEQSGIFAKFPFVLYNYDKNSISVKEEAIANPMVGFYHWFDNILLKAAIQFPALSENKLTAASFGSLADLYYSGMFYPKYTGAYITVGYNYKLNDSYGIMTKLSSVNLINTKDNELDNQLNYLTAHLTMYGKFLEMVNASVGFNGYVNINQDMGSFADRSLFNAVVKVGTELNNFKPALFVKIPIDKDYRDQVSVIAGIKLSYELEF